MSRRKGRQTRLERVRLAGWGESVQAVRAVDGRSGAAREQDVALAAARTFDDQQASPPRDVPERFKKVINDPVADRKSGIRNCPLEERKQAPGNFGRFT